VLGRRDGATVTASVIVACVEERRGAPMFLCRALPVDSERHSDSE
jgi:hypothetical protein